MPPRRKPAEPKADEFPVDPVADPDLVCGIDECAYVGKGKIPKADLGLHRYRVHGIRGTSAQAQRKHAGGSTPIRRSKAKPRDAGSKEPTERASVRKAATSASDGIRKLGVLVSPRLPVTGRYCLRSSDELAGYLAGIAADNPKLLRWLQTSSQAADWVGLAWWAGGFAYAVGIDLGSLPVDSLAAQEFGLAADVEIVDRELEARGYTVQREGEPEPLSVPSVLGNGEGAPAPDVEAGGPR